MFQKEVVIITMITLSNWSVEELEQARKEIDKAEGSKPMKQSMFKVV